MSRSTRVNMSDEDAEQTSEKLSKRAKPGGFWNKVFWLIVILIVSGLAVFFSFVWMWGKGVDSTRETIGDLAKIFRPEKVVQTFEEWREMEASATDGNILEVATAKATEKFTRKTNVSMFGTTLPLGTTVSEISVPATYRYHIDLNGDWFVTTDGSRILVMAPRIEPSLPVAFDTAGVKKKSKSGWARWDGADDLLDLEKSLTGKLAQRAASPEAIGKMQDEGREAVAKFVKTWLLKEDAWGDERFTEIVVMFEGEKGKSLSSMPATLRFETPEKGTVLP